MSGRIQRSVSRAVEQLDIYDRQRGKRTTLNSDHFQRPGRRGSQVSTDQHGHGFEHSGERTPREYAPAR